MDLFCTFKYIISPLFVEFYLFKAYSKPHDPGTHFW